MMKLARFFDNFFGGINAINNNITTGIKYLPCTPSVTYLPTGVHWKFIPRITNINTKSDKNTNHILLDNLNYLFFVSSNKIGVPNNKP